LVRQLRREVDEHKRRCTELLGEVSELRKDRDLLKLERGEMQVKQQRELEELRNQARSLTSEVERVTFKQQTAEDEKQKLLLKLEKRATEVASSLSEKANLNSFLREKDLLLESL